MKHVDIWLRYIQAENRFVFVLLNFKPCPVKQHAKFGNVGNFWEILELM